MDDLAPAPAQRTSDDGGRKLEGNFASRRKAVKKVPPPPAKNQALVPDLEPEPEPEVDHELDVLA